MDALSRRVAEQLRKWATAIDEGTCNVSPEQAAMVFNMAGALNEPMSKEHAASYLGLHRSRFDDLVREGKIPHGKKRRGFKELIWYKNELDKVKE